MHRASIEQDNTQSYDSSPSNVCSDTPYHNKLALIRVVHASFFREISSFDTFGVGRSFWDPDEIGNV